MTKYTFNQHRTWNEANSPQFDLKAGDSLTLGTSANVVSNGANSPAAQMTSNASVKLEGKSGTERALVNAKDTAFHATGGNITFEMESWSYVKGGNHALLLEGTGNSISFAGTTFINAGSPSSTSAVTVHSGGSSSLGNAGMMDAQGASSTAILMTSGGNTLSNSGRILSDYAGIDIHGSNNTIANTGNLSTTHGTALRMSGSEGGTNSITNAGRLTTNPATTPDSSASGTAIEVLGTSADMLTNEAGGFIFGGINLDGGNDVIVNKGELTSEAILGAGDDVVENHGDISGGVDFGLGNDTLKNDGDFEGSYNGGVKMGAGADTVMNGGRFATHVNLGAGNDSYFSNYQGVYARKGKTPGDAGGTVQGDAGNDSIYGGDYVDELSGGTGRDLLVGGKGKDTFIFDSALGRGNVDTIKDFQTGIDSILLEDTVFKAFKLPKGEGNMDLPADAFRLGSGPKDASDRIGYNSESGVLWYDADGTGSAKTVAFAKLAAGLKVGAGDFYIG